MSDFVAETDNLSVSGWAGAARAADDAVGRLCAASLQTGLQTLEAALWIAETGAGAAGAAAEMAETARQARESTVRLIAEATRAA